MELPGRGVGKGVVMLLRRVRLVLPSPAVVQFHPVVFAVFNLACTLESLREEVLEVVVVWGIFETEVADVSQVFGEFFYAYLISAA